MPRFSNHSLEHLAATASDLSLIDSYHFVFHYVLIKIGQKRYVFDPPRARVELRRLINTHWSTVRHPANTVVH